MSERDSEGAPYTPSYPTAPGNARRPLPQGSITPEEQRVLKACQRDSTFQRAIPLALASGVATYLSVVKWGFLKPHANYGSSPKVVMASALGYIFGKISYFRSCQDRILNEIPNSTLAAAVRNARGYPPLAQPPSFSNESPLPAEPLQPLIEEPLPPQGTYEELRKRNRQRYDTQQAGKPYEVPPPVQVSEYTPPNRHSPSPSVMSPTSKNKYGDEGFE